MSTSFFSVLQSVCTIAHENVPTDFGDVTQPYPEIKFYIQNVLEEICDGFPWKFRERIYTFNTVAGQKQYTLNMDFSNIIEDGIRVAGLFPPLYYVPNTELDQFVSTSGKPYRYSLYDGQILLDPVPDNVYSISIKYLTTNFAFAGDGVTEQPNLINASDISIIPDRYIKTLVWGAYAFYRQNFKPDPKYTLACDNFQAYLLEMQQNNNDGGDSGPVITIGKRFNDKRSLLVQEFLNQQV